MTKDNFSEIVGQEKTKGKINFLLEGFEQTRIMPHLLFVAPRGCGKTLIAQKTANLMNRQKTLIVNCSTIKNVKSFFNQIMLPFVAPDNSNSPKTTYPPCRTLSCQINGSTCLPSSLNQYQIQKIIIIYQLIQV
jgi:predicted ATPase with chaperone activity